MYGMEPTRKLSFLFFFGKRETEGKRRKEDGAAATGSENQCYLLNNTKVILQRMFSLENIN
jgi:hypothetical protein